MQSQLRSVLPAWKPGGTWGAWEVSRLLPFRWKADDGLPAYFRHTKNWFLSHGIEVQLQGHLNTTNDHDRRKNQILKDSPKVLFWCLRPKCSFPYINSTHVENSSHFPHIEIYCQERLAIFPHILWCEERVSSHFPSPSSSSISSHFGCVELAATNFLTLFHTLVRAGKSNEKFLTFFQCVERSFPHINSTHAENSLLFPHFFLTFSSHWNFIVIIMCLFHCLVSTLPHSFRVSVSLLSEILPLIWAILQKILRSVSVAHPPQMGPVTPLGSLRDYVVICVHWNWKLSTQCLKFNQPWNLCKMEPMSILS